MKEVVGERLSHDYFYVKKSFIKVDPELLSPQGGVPELMQN